MGQNKEIAIKILKELGGSENIEINSICMTRLRVKLKKELDDSNISNLKNITSIMGVVKVDDNNIQIVLGPGKVSNIGSEFSKLTKIPLGELKDKSTNKQSLNDITNENKLANKQKYNTVVQCFLQKIANVFVPILPAIIASGLILGLTNVINVSTKGEFNNIWWYQSIRTTGWATFTYLSIFVCMNTVKEFSGTPILGAVIGALFVNNEAMPLMTKLGENNLILPLTNKPYMPNMGGLLAALFMGIIIAFLEKRIRKIMPNILDTFFTPLLTLVISVFLAILIIQPLGEVLTIGMFEILSFIFSNKLGIVGGYLLSASFLPLVSVGLHHALTPIHVMLNNPDGPTNGINVLLPILMTAGGGQVGAGIALYIKTKNEKLKRLTRDSIPIGILGIGEPLMYAVTLPLGKPFITACLGSGIGGMLAVLFKLGTITQGVSGLFGLLIIRPGTQILYIIAMLGAYIGGFILTYLFGVDEKRINEIYEE